jgi:hypothetical protein
VEIHGDKMISKFGLILIGCFLFAGAVFAQEEESMPVEINIIDSYVTPDEPYRFFLTFFTDDSCTSKILLHEKYEFIISPVPTDDHKAEIEITKLKFDSSVVSYRISVTDRNNREIVSDTYDLILPHHEESFADNSSSIFTICCFGGVIFGVPSPGYVNAGGKKYFSLSKEIPLLSFYDSGYNYPTSYLGIEYSYVFKAPNKNYLRIGYKYLFQPGAIEYISTGINFTSDFKGFNGLSPELSVGLFTLQNAFTVYTRYRFNWQPGESARDFHEISIGLYSNFFSLNL